MFYNARWYDPYLNRFTQPDSIVPDPLNLHDWDRYSYARNNPVRYNDPTGHKGEDGCGANGCPKENLLSEILSTFQNVDIKNPDDWKLSELRLLNHTLHLALDALGRNSKAFYLAFGNLVFEVVPDGSLGEYNGWSDWNTGVIQLTHLSFLAWSDGFLVLHEMGHMFDARWSNNDPKRYKSQLFVDVLNGGCEHLGVHGCLGYDPGDYIWGNWTSFFQGTGEYHPSDDHTTSYALEKGSMEDFAESFAYTILGDPNDMISGTREFIIQTFVNLTVSYSQ